MNLSQISFTVHSPVLVNSCKIHCCFRVLLQWPVKARAKPMKDLRNQILKKKQVSDLDLEIQEFSMFTLLIVLTRLHPT